MLFSYNPFYFFQNMTDFNYTDRQTELYRAVLELKTILDYYYKFIKFDNFTKFYTTFNEEFTCIKDNLITLNTENTLNNNLRDLITDTIYDIDTYITEFEENYNFSDESVILTNITTFVDETGLDNTSFEILNYLKTKKYGQDIINTLNQLIENIEYEPFTDVLSSITALLKYKSSSEALPFSTLLYVEKHKDLQGTLDRYLAEEDVSTKKDILKDLHMKIIQNKLKEMYFEQ